MSNTPKIPSLRVSSDKRHIVDENGKPFFYLADTAWELFHRLTREEAVEYLSDRAEYGFAAIQAVALAEFDGLGTPNAYGRTPLLKNAEGMYDPTLPDLDGDYSYWAHVDFVVEEAKKRGLFIAMLPTWGDKYNKCWGVGPEIFNTENAKLYGSFIAERYAKYGNIIWVLGGDRALTTRSHFEVICSMAEGIRSVVGASQLITFHPTGGSSSSTQLHNEKWLDFNMIQSGHTRTFYNYEMITKTYGTNPPKPVIDGEPGYENHPENFNIANGYLDASDARQFIYMSLFSGACGHTYGNHSIWAMAKKLPVDGFKPGHFCLTWRQALTSPGSRQMKYAKELWLSRDILSSKPAPELVKEDFPGILHIPVLKGKDFLFAYTAQGCPVTLKNGFMDGRKCTASWYNPRNGEYLDSFTLDDSAETPLYPPTGGRGNDWVLVATAE